MTRISEQSIDKILSSISDEDLRTIVRNYALTHPTMYEALKSLGMPAPKAAVFDYKTEVARCFRHFMKTPRWEHDWHRQPQFLDWEEVGKDLRKVIKRAEMSIDAGNPGIAIETAFLILEMDDRQYEEDWLCEREDWDADVLCLDDCFELIEKALASPLLSKEQKLEICDRLDQFHRSDILEYAEYDLQELIESIRGELLTNDEHLAVLMRDFKNEDGWRMSSLACEIWDFLMDLGRNDEAEDFFLDHPQIDELRARYIKYLLAVGDEDKAMKAVDDGIKLAKKQDLRGLVRKWRERKLEMLEAKGDRAASASLCKELFADAHGQDVLKYYHKAKQLVNPDRWPTFRDTMLESNPGLCYSADSPLAEILREEHLFDRLYTHLFNARSNLLTALSRYAKEFTPQQQKNLVDRLEKSFPISFGSNANRKTYQELVGRLNTLARTCSSGKELAARVVSEYRRKFPNRPALLEELAKANL